MSEGGPLAGRVVAVIGTGSELDRAVAVRCAEAGADIALGTEGDARDQDYAMNSIANEVWAIGREQFVTVLTGADGIGELVHEARARLGRCDVVVARAEPAEADGVPVLEPGETAEETVEAVLARAGRLVVEGDR